MSAQRLVHHELCFGCGRTNLFGLLMEVTPAGEGQVTGRGFIKQDHQGADRGTCHEGVIVAALSDAMAFACGTDMRPTNLEVELHAAVPVGSFLDVEAQRVGAAGDASEATARGLVDGHPVATARGRFGPATSQ